MTPADELRTAADTLRALATAAATDSDGNPTAHWAVRYRPGVTPGAPEQRDRPVTLVAVDLGTDEPLLHGGSSGSHGRGSRPSIGPDHGRYAAAMDPAVGLALATLLEAVLSSTREASPAHEECAAWCSPETCDLSAALAVARQINGAS
ncbi:hypothetical protein KVH27_19410 [Streptomyces olivaceus]|uniref:hypothetical protein n=1 Tax=Streptomyces olivaceus TaxID=47716 RepID=UPI001CCF4A41|nr:hypothetical protein [Streptomyces olivaceus]MBZ6250536.1 hypothetical protein [Streptomyces olivaceus]